MSEIDDYRDCRQSKTKCPDMCCQDRRELAYKKSAIQIQATNAKELILETQQSVPFDKIVTATPRKFTIKKNGTIVFNEPGYYTARWIVELVGAGDIDEINLAFQNIEDGSMIQCSSTVCLQNQITGEALVKSAKSFQRYRLMNNSTDVLQLANTTVQANLLIVKI